MALKQLCHKYMPCMETCAQTPMRTNMYAQVVPHWQPSYPKNAPLTPSVGNRENGDADFVVVDSSHAH
eukprot:2244467-Amphidinium_carterae.3